MNDKGVCRTVPATPGLLKKIKLKTKNITNYLCKTLKI